MNTVRELDRFNAFMHRGALPGLNLGLAIDAVIMFSLLCISLVNCGGEQEEVELTEAPVILSPDAEVMRESFREALAIVELENLSWLVDCDAEVTAAAIIAVPLFERRIGNNSQ